MKKEIDYGGNIISSLKSLINNLNLFVPDLAFLALSLLLGYIFLHFNGLLAGLYDSTHLSEIIKSTFSHTPSIVKLIASFAFVIIIGILIGLKTASMRYVMLKNIVKNGKFSLKSAYKESGKYTATIFMTRLLLALLVVIPFLIFGSVVGLTALSLKNFAIIKSMIYLISLILALAYIISVEIAFVFTYPTLLFKTNKGSYNTLKEAYYYFKINKKKTILTALILAGVGIAFAVFFSGISFVIGIFYSLLGITSGKFSIIIIIFGVAWYIIRRLINIAVSLWGQLFVFKNY